MWDVLTRRALAFALAAALLGAGLLGCGFDTSSEPAKSTASSERIFMLGAPKSDRGAVNGVLLYTMETATGRLERRQLPRLGIGDPLHFLDVTGNRLVYFGVNGTTFSIDLDLSGAPLRLGPSLYFIPSATDGRAWLQEGPRTSPHPKRYLRLREVTVDGDVVVNGRSTNPPCPGPGIVAAVRDAVLCQGEHAGLIAASPRTGRGIAAIPGRAFPLATGGDLVATCGEPCPQLYVSDPVARTRFRIEPRQSFSWEAGYRGAFSPGGSLLAVPVRPTRPPDDGRQSTRRVAIVDLRDRAAHVVPGSRMRQGGPLAFSSSGESVFFVTPDGEVMDYRVADESLETIGSVAEIDVYDLAAS